MIRSSRASGYFLHSSYGSTAFEVLTSTALAHAYAWLEMFMCTWSLNYGF